MTGVYVQSPTFADPTTPRDSGYDSLQRHMSVLDRLKQTHSVWLLLGLGDEEAVRILESQPPGVSAGHVVLGCSCTLCAKYTLFPPLGLPQRSAVECCTLARLHFVSMATMPACQRSRMSR